MENEKIIEELNSRFAEPIPEFYKRHIIFWNDEDGEFADQIEGLALANAKVIVLTGRNMFAVKKQLIVDDRTSHFLVYRPFPLQYDDNWLLNIELYSGVFLADLTSGYMDEMHLHQTPALRKCVKSLHKFFSAKDRRKKITTLIEKKEIATPTGLHLGVMAAICNLKDMHPDSILREVLSHGLHKDTNAIYSDFVHFEVENVFLAMVGQTVGYYETDLDLGRLATHILLTATTKTLSQEFLVGLDSFISIPHQSHCYDFTSAWLYGTEKDTLYDIVRTVEAELQLPKRFQALSVLDLADTETFPCINESILIQIMNDIKNQLIDIDLIVSMVEKRRTMAWADKVGDYFEGILQVAYMQNFYKQYASSFTEVEARKVWQLYTEQYYKMDTYYRLYHLAFAKSLKVSTPALDDLLKQVTDVVEGMYTNWFLGKLGANWSNASDDELETFGEIQEVPKQQDFYSSQVAFSDNRVFVIVSDALRYEVAVSLSEQLKRETQAKVDLQNRQAMFPTITKFGMAALLPHNELTAELRNDKLTVLIDGGLTESNYRDKILKSHNAKSVAVKYNDIVAMKRAERSEIVKGKTVVYIYHDTIDEASHSSDTAVFLACEEAIAEIKNMIRIIVNDFGGTHVMITADHGFLYNYSPLQEMDKADKSSFQNQVAEYGRRYAILKPGANPEYLLPVKFMNGAFQGFAPRENIRLKMNGGGLNFVHGGVSLQEMVIPVIAYRHLRNTTKEYLRNKQKYDTKPVVLNLLSASRKISNMVFSLNFYQTEAVSDNREMATYLLYFVDADGTQVSDTQKIIADRANKNGQERTFRQVFHLKALKYSNTETYYLMIVDENGTLLPQREEFTIDIAFAVEEFNFFD